MVSDNESEFTDSKAEFTDLKASLNQFDSGGRTSSQNFLIIFHNFNFLTCLLQGYTHKQRIQPDTSKAQL